jgi:hypothetical protein
MQEYQRRFLPRLNRNIPLRFRPASENGPEWTGHSTNISMHGAYLIADFTTSIGELLRIWIEIPQEMSGKQSAEYCFTAKIIHMEADRSETGKVGIGVKFLWYVLAEEIEKGVRAANS